MTKPSTPPSDDARHCVGKPPSALPSPVDLKSAKEYVYDSRVCVAIPGSPRIQPSQLKIKVQTRWAGLLNADAPASLRTPHRKADSYCSNSRLLTVESVFSRDEAERLVQMADAIGFGRTNCNSPPVALLTAHNAHNARELALLLLVSQSPNPVRRSTNVSWKPALNHH